MTLFIVLLAGTLLLLAPVSGRLDESLVSFRASLAGILQEQTGLSFSYASLSPSVFRSLEMRGLEIRDASNGIRIARLERVSVSYRILPLLRGNYEQAIAAVSLENGTLSLDLTGNAGLFDRIRALADIAVRTPVKPDAGKEVYPFDIRVRNISLEYRDGDQRITGTIARGGARVGAGNTGFTLDSRLHIESPLLAGIGPLDTGITLKGALDRSFEAGSASVMIRSLESRNFTVSRFGLALSFRSGKISVSSVQDLQPLDLGVEWDIAAREGDVRLECERLLPLRWIGMKKPDRFLKSLADTELTGSVSAHLAGTGAPSYRFDLEAGIPSSLYGGAKLDVSASGSPSRIDIGSLSLDGPKVRLGYSGSVDLVHLVPEGLLSVGYLSLPGSVTASGEVSLERSSSGFTCLVPELRLNDTVYSAVDLALAPSPESLDFSVSAYDSTGHIGVEGSYIGGKKPFVQLYLACDSVSARDTAAVVSAFGLGTESTSAPGFGAGLESYALTTEAYFSTDLATFSFNCPRLVFASREKDGPFVLLSAKGTESGVDISDIAFSRAGYSLEGNVHAGFGKSGDIMFDSSLQLNSIPYTLSGMFSKGILSLYGDYGLAATLLLSSDGGLSGSFRVSGFPVPVGRLMLSCSVQAGLSFPQGAPWKVSLKDGSVQEVSGIMPLETQVSFQGMIDRNGLFFDELSLNDQASRITGYGGVSILPGTAGPDGTVSGQGYSVEASLSAGGSGESGESLEISGQLISSDDLYFNSRIRVRDCPLMRLMRGQQSVDLLSFSLDLSGTPDTVYASGEVGKLVCRMADFDLDARGKFLLEDRILSIFDAGGSWNGNTLSDLTGKLSLDGMGASLSGSYSSLLGSHGLSAAIEIGFAPGKPVSGGFPESMKQVLDRCTVTASVKDVLWNNLEYPGPIGCTFVREPGITTVYAGKKDSLTGFLLDDGTFSLNSAPGNPVEFQADGEIIKSAISLRVSGIHGDLGRLWPVLALPMLRVNSGTVDGELSISGLLNDPEFSGELRARNLGIELPGILGESFGPASFEIKADTKQLSIPRFELAGAHGALAIEAGVEFDRWLPASVRVHAVTLPGRMLRLEMENPLVKATGLVSGDLEVTMAPEGIRISGDAGYEQGSFAVLLAGFSRLPQAGEQLLPDIRADVRLNIGKKVEFRWPNNDIPIIRGLIQAEQPVGLSVDTGLGTFRLHGTAKLRGGEIFYLKRSFYIRQGQIAFNENQDLFDPVITLRAEIRESDIGPETRGEPVRIILSSENQPLSAFTPVLSSDPVKSNLEIMELLGQVTSGDASRETLLRDTVINASDIFTQMSLFRNAENSVRDLFRLDLFSIRTLILQNALLGPAMRTPDEKPMTIGNYFDNTTVYMGKYLGSAIYADALLHFSYYDPKSAQNAGKKYTTYGNLLFQPELGLEVTTPLFLLRWGITPGSPGTLFVADNSVTLSWKFSY